MSSVFVSFVSCAFPRQSPRKMAGKCLHVDRETFIWFGVAEEIYSDAGTLLTSLFSRPWADLHFYVGMGFLSGCGVSPDEFDARLAITATNKLPNGGMLKWGVYTPRSRRWMCLNRLESQRIRLCSFIWMYHSGRFFRYFDSHRFHATLIVLL